uniref:F-box domain-containing protein n=1 Tax=Eutreptiella gymnastica TaxID=73025 RepID=A0A7S4G643_9EUGL
MWQRFSRLFSATEDATNDAIDSMGQAPSGTLTLDLVMDPDPRTTLGSLQSLPSDVLIRILLHMTIREVFVIMQVNRECLALTQEPVNCVSVWHSLNKRFPWQGREPEEPVRRSTPLLCTPSEVETDWRQTFKWKLIKVELRHRHRNLLNEVASLRRERIDAINNIERSYIRQKQEVLQRCQLICIGIAVCLGTAAWSGLHFLVSSFICNCLLVVLGLASARQEYHLHCMHERQKHWLEKLMQGFAHILAAVATALALAVVGTVRFLLTIIAVRGRMNCPSRRMVDVVLAALFAMVWADCYFLRRGRRKGPRPYWLVLIGVCMLFGAWEVATLTWFILSRMQALVAACLLGFLSMEPSQGSLQTLPSFSIELLEKARDADSERCRASFVTQETTVQAQADRVQTAIRTYDPEEDEDATTSGTKCCMM